MRRTVFFISDGTAITTETVGHSLLTQFPGVHFVQVRIPFVDNEEAVYHTCIARGPVAPARTAIRLGSLT